MIKIANRTPDFRSPTHMPPLSLSAKAVFLKMSRFACLKVALGVGRAGSTLMLSVTCSSWNTRVITILRFLWASPCFYKTGKSKF